MAAQSDFLAEDLRADFWLVSPLVLGPQTAVAHYDSGMLGWLTFPMHVIRSCLIMVLNCMEEGNV